MAEMKEQQRGGDHNKGQLQRLQRVDLPLVDLSLPEEESSQLLRQGCEDAGFFFLTNHGIPQDLLSRTWKQVEALFSLPLFEKEKLFDPKTNRGYTAFEEQALDPTKQTSRGDCKEGYYIGTEIPEAHPRANLPLHGPNVWPSLEQLPEFRPTMEAYHEAATATCFKLLRIMAIALELSPDFFLQPGRFDHAMCFLRLLHYSLEESKPEEGIFGAGAHTDYGMITLLATQGPGLQICRDPSQSPQLWEDVAPPEGAFVVNVGDMLERWTNGKWRSTLHRVLIPAGMQKDRYSLPFFLDPNFDCHVEALPTCTSFTDPPKWLPTTAGEHLLSMYKKSHKGLDEYLNAA